MKRPIGVTLLAILAGIAALVAAINTLQMLHLLPIGVDTPLGSFRFFTFDIWGALMWGLLTLVWFSVLKWLWDVNPQGWLFCAALSTLNLVLVLFTWIGGTPWEAIMPPVL